MSKVAEPLTSDVPPLVANGALASQMKQKQLRLAFLIIGSVLFFTRVEALEPLDGQYPGTRQHRFKDGVTLRVYYSDKTLKDAGESRRFAALVLKNAVMAYQTIVEQMGFSTPGYSFSQPNRNYAHDPDRSLDIYLGSGPSFKDAPCFDTVRVSATATHAVILLPAAYKDFIRRWEKVNPSSLGKRDVDADLKGTLIHEMLHVILFYYNRNLGQERAEDAVSDVKADWYVEGLARYFETLVGAKHDFYSQGFKETLPDKIRFSRGGSNYYLRYPDQVFTDLRYENALFWKFIDDRFGMRAIERFSRALRSRGRGDLNRSMIKVFGATLKDLLRDFAVATLLKDFKMGPETALLQEVARARLVYRAKNLYLVDGDGVEKKLGNTCRTDWIGRWSGMKAIHGAPSVAGDATEKCDVSSQATDFYEVDLSRPEGRLPWLGLNEAAGRSLILQVMLFYENGSFTIHRTGSLPLPHWHLPAIRQAGAGDRRQEGTDVAGPQGLDLEKAAISDSMAPRQVRKAYLLITNPGPTPLDYEIFLRS